MGGGECGRPKEVSGDPGQWGVRLTDHCQSLSGGQIKKKKSLFIYFERERERERERETVWVGQKEWERIPSMLGALSAEPDAGINPVNREIMT